MPVNPNAPIEITAFEWVPDVAQGVVRDLLARLSAYLKRGEARPAFQRALADQLEVYAQHQPQGEAA